MRQRLTFKTVSDPFFSFQDGISYIQSAEQLSFVCLIEQAGSGEADKTLSLQARGSDKSPDPLFVPSKIER